MKKWSVAAIAIAVLALSSCVTVNEFDSYNLEGSLVAGRIMPVPELEVDIARTTIPGAENGGLLGIIQLGADIMVTAEEYSLEQRLANALSPQDISEVFRADFVPYTLDLLGATQGSRENADYMLEIEVLQYGIRTDNGGGVYLRMRLESRIRDRYGNLVWRRRETEEYAASPSMFGINDVISAAVSITVLEDLTPEELHAGLMRTAKQVAFEMGRKLTKDYYK